MENNLYDDEIDYEDGDDGDIFDNSAVYLTISERSLIGWIIKECPTIEVTGIRTTTDEFTPLDLEILNKITLSTLGEPLPIKRSSFGMTDLTLENLAIRNKKLSILSGSGSRVLSEWWEKEDGTDCIFFSVGMHHFCMLFRNHKWVITPSTCFLSEGAEYLEKKHEIVIRQALYSTLILTHFPDIKIRTVQRKSFEESFDVQEGIVTMVDGHLFRLKRFHTIDLKTVGDRACTQDGTVCFRTDKKGINEYTIDGAWLRERRDKVKADIKVKYDRLKKLPILPDLENLIDQVVEGDHIPSMPYHVGYDVVAQVVKPGQDAVIVAGEQFTQKYTADQTGMQHVPIQPLGNFVTEHKGGFFVNATKLIKMMNRVGITYDPWDLRHQLFSNGVYQYYEHWKCTRSWNPDFVYIPAPVTLPLYQPLDGVNTFTRGGHVYPDALMVPYNQTIDDLGVTERYCRDCPYDTQYFSTYTDIKRDDTYLRSRLVDQKIMESIVLGDPIYSQHRIRPTLLVKGLERLLSRGNIYVHEGRLYPTYVIMSDQKLMSVCKIQIGPDGKNYGERVEGPSYEYQIESPPVEWGSSVGNRVVWWYGDVISAINARVCGIKVHFDTLDCIEMWLFDNGSELKAWCEREGYPIEYKFPVVVARVKTKDK